MADVLTKSKRSQVMAAIRSTGNRATELKLAALFREYGITGWRRRQMVFGKPDFIFRQQKIAVFVDGCFWHGCRWHCRRPKARTDFWHPKIAKNQVRDQNVNQMLKSQGWHVIRIWEHALREPERILTRLQATLASRRQNE